MSLAILLSGAVYVWAATRSIRWLVYLLKPGTMALIIWLAAQQSRGTEAPLYGWLILVGLLFSVVGDVALMLPSNLFLGGVAAFFAAHVCYIGALVWGLNARLVPLDLATGAVLAAYSWFMYRRLAEGIRRLEQNALLVPVAVYCAAIGVMVWRAASLLFQSVGGPISPPLVVAASLLFLASDSTLAWDRFVSPLPYRDLAVMSTYFCAQYLFAISI